MKAPKKEEASFNIASLLISIFSAIFIFTGSFAIYYFSRGYRLDFTQRQIRKTGVLTVQTEPSGANIYLQEENLGRTPRSRTLDVGIYTISVRKQEYREWSKDIEIKEEKSTPIFPFLILENITKTTIWNSEYPILKYWINEGSDYFVFLVQNESELYSLWTYRINSPIWNLTPNPIETLVIESNEPNLQISPNGQLALLEENLEYYIIELQRSNNSVANLQPLTIPSEQEYKISWSMDNKYLVLESDLQIISLDTSNNNIYTLIEKEAEKEYIWTTDEEGFFYSVEALHTQEDENYIYAIKQTKLDGTNTRFTTEKVYFQKDESYIEYYRNNGEVYPEFKNSPQSTQTTGQIVDIRVNQSAKGVYIKTNTSSYWYDIDSNRYRMISPYPADLLQFSPNSELLLFANGEKIYSFRFAKEEADHTKELGSKRVDALIKNETTRLNWLSNSSYISYIKDSTLYISEKDGENAQDIVSTENILLYSIKHSRDQIITLETGDPITGFQTSINQYIIR